MTKQYEKENKEIAYMVYNEYDTEVKADIADMRRADNQIAVGRRTAEEARRPQLLQTV